MLRPRYASEWRRRPEHFAGSRLAIIDAARSPHLSDPRFRPRSVSGQLSRDGLARFLRALDADETTAGERYEHLRATLVRFFEWRGAPLPDLHADDTLNRVVRKLEQGEAIQDPRAYCYGVARLVLLEAVKRRVKEEEAAREYHRRAPGGADDDLDDRVRCLRRCLESLPPSEQDLVRDYYRGSGSDRIDGRRRLAERLGIGMNALRIRAFRLSGKLQACVTRCVQPPAAIEMDARPETHPSRAHR